ncbi:MAG: VOC family protein [Chthoniobacterales bacterium]|nr:VOC family protein [Chthoniobacterales bacterium]
MTKPPRIFETVLYADDLPAAERFYAGVLGLEVISSSELLVSFRCTGGVLLIFDPKLSSQRGRDLPSHGKSGAGHLAFAATAEELEQWRTRLAAAGVPIEMDVPWEQGGRSLYFRDPAGNSIEFAPLTLWGGGW